MGGEFKIYSTLSRLFESEKLLKTTSFWIDCFAPSLNELEMCKCIFQLHPLSVENILSEECRDKVEIFENYLFLSLRTPVKIESNLSAFAEETLIVNWYVAVFSNCILSFHNHPIPHVDRMISRLKISSFLRPDWIFYFILDSVTEKYPLDIQKATRNTEMLGEMILELNNEKEAENDCQERDFFQRISLNQKKLTRLYKLILPKKEILMNIINRKTVHIHKRTYLYIRDLYTELTSALYLLENSIESLECFHTNYISKVSLNVAIHSCKLNLLVNKLLLTAAVCFPLGVLAGIFSWNMVVPAVQKSFEVPHPGFSETQGPFWIGVAGVFCIFTLSLLMAKVWKLI
eukprot:Sdes_comp19733_c0_seq2m11710